MNEIKYYLLLSTVLFTSNVNNENAESIHTYLLGGYYEL